MNICFIISSLQKPAGTERIASLLANELSKKHNVTIISRDSNSVIPVFKLNANVKIKNIEGGILNFYLGLKNFVYKERYDAIFVHNMGKLTPFALLSLGSKVSILSIEHVSFVTRNIVLKLVSKLLYKKLKMIITINTNDEQEFKTFVEPNKVVRISNPSPFKISARGNSNFNENKSVIAIGRLSYEKNFSALIEAWHLLGEKTHGWILNIYGDGDEKDKLNNLIKSTKSKNIFLLSSTRDISSVYINSKFLVMSSRYEGFGMVLIEAMSFGKPVISFNCPHGPADIVENHLNGILVENGNINELSQSIGLLIENDKLRDRLAEGALNSAKKYDISTIAEQWEELLNKLY